MRTGSFKLPPPIPITTPYQNLDLFTQVPLGTIQMPEVTLDITPPTMVIPTTVLTNGVILPGTNTIQTPKTNTNTYQNPTTMGIRPPVLSPLPPAPGRKQPTRVTTRSPVRSPVKSPVLPRYNTPVSPVYNTPVYNTPVYNTPVYNTPVYNTPVLHPIGSPIRSPPRYTTPVSPRYNSPVRSPTLPRYTPVKSPVKTENCCICYDDIPISNKLKCDHVVCGPCIDRLQKLECPMCKTNLEGPLVTDEVVANILNRQEQDRLAYINADYMAALYLEEHPEANPEEVYRMYRNE